MMWLDYTQLNKMDQHMYFYGLIGQSVWQICIVKATEYMRFIFNTIPVKYKQASAL